MTDRLDAIAAGLRDGRYDCRVPGDTDDVRWLVEEVTRARSERDGWSSTANNLVALVGKAEVDLDALREQVADRDALWKQMKSAEAEAEQMAGELAALRERHAAAVKSAYIEGRNSDEFDAADKFIEDEYSWLASEAKARLT